MTDDRDFINTLRGRFIIAKALAYAITTIDQLPIEKREASDRDDMVHLLTGTFGQWAGFAVHSALVHTGNMPDLLDHKTGAKPPKDVVEFVEAMQGMRTARNAFAGKVVPLKS